MSTSYRRRAARRSDGTGAGGRSPRRRRSPVVQWRGQLRPQGRRGRVGAGPDGRPRLRSEARQLLLRADPALPQAGRCDPAGLVIGQVLTTMAAPLLIGMVIDHGLPDALDGNYRTLLQLTGALVAAAVTSGGRCSGSSCAGPARSARRSCSTCAGGSSTTPSGCRVSWHERFTSGRVISRLTSDVDTLRELLDASLDGLLLAVLNIVVISVLMLVLDPWLALIALSAIVPLWLLFRWFSAPRRWPSGAPARRWRC